MYNDQNQQFYFNTLTKFCCWNFILFKPAECLSSSSGTIVDVMIVALENQSLLILHTAKYRDLSGANHWVKASLHYMMKRMPGPGRVFHAELNYIAALILLLRLVGLQVMWRTNSPSPSGCVPRVLWSRQVFGRLGGDSAGLRRGGRNHGTA